MTEEVLDRHYKSLSERYNDFLYYSPGFVRTLTSKMIEMLELRETDVFVDLGCGTAMYSLDIIQQLPLKERVIAVDPYPEMLAQIPQDAYVEKVALDALSFARKPAAYDKVLIKEAIHHVPEREELFDCLYKRLNDGGILLLVHVPPKVEYPLFKKALDRCLEWHADPDELSEQLKAAGFRLERDSVRYPHAIAKEKYFQMVQNCYMSVLTSMDKDDIEEGLLEMEREYRDHDVLRFVDHFDYLKAVK